MRQPLSCCKGRDQQKLVPLSEMRRVNRRKALNAVRDFDAFPKVPEDYIKKSVRGGSLSLLSFSLIALLVVSEFLYYTSTVYKYEYSVDSDVSSKLDINVDLTVAMPCEAIGADVLDLAGETVHTEDFLTLEAAVFELTQEQRSWLKAKQSILARVSEYRSLSELMTLKSSPMPNSGSTDKALKIDQGSCRLWGTLRVNKVAGNFHITIGKHIQDPLQRSGHRHFGAYVPQELYNLSHRIDRLSFGTEVPGIVNPLDATLQVTEMKPYVYQYYIQVVPTEYDTMWRKVRTNQFSVTERERAVTMDRSGSGVPGIFFKYDLSSMVVKIKQERQPFWQFLVRLCGIVGGVFATSGMIHTFVGLLYEYAQFRRRNGKPNTNQQSSSSLPSGSVSTSSDHIGAASSYQYGQVEGNSSLQQNWSEAVQNHSDIQAS